MHVIGLTGSGKSRFLAHWFLTLFEAGFPVTLVDPHGDLARLVVDHLIDKGYFKQPDAYDRLLYLDLPAGEQASQFVPYNVLSQGYPVHTRAQLVLEALKRAWPSLEGGVAPAFENIVLAGVSILLFHQLPLYRLHDVLVDKKWRDKLLESMPDTQVVGFFRDRYDKWGREQPLIIESTLRRVFLLSFSPVLRFSLGQRGNLLDYRRIFATRQSVIVNLALHDPDARRLLGCLMMVSAEQAALSLSDVPEKDRPGSHHLIIDEFAEVSAQSEETLSRVLALTRKFGLVLVLSHQMWTQASAKLQGALANAGVEAAFRLGRADAEVEAMLLGRVNPLTVKHEVIDKDALRRTHPTFYSLPEQWENTTQTLTDLPNQQALVRLPNGRVERIRTFHFPDVAIEETEREAIRSEYFRRFFVPQEMIEKEIEEQTVQHSVTKRREVLRKAR
jgi:hypothetical protein